MTEKNDNKRSGGIEPFKSGPDKDIENKDTASPAKDITIEPVNQEELAMLLSEPTGYADIVKQIRKDTISPSKNDKQEKISNIPEYDLGKQMLAAQRKNTAAKRGAPGQKAPIPIKSVAASAPVKPARRVDTKQAPPIDIQSEAVIREIVARDIARLCRYNRA